jgi:hypothetical protein
MLMQSGSAALPLHSPTPEPVPESVQTVSAATGISSLSGQQFPFSSQQSTGAIVHWFPSVSHD